MKYMPSFAFLKESIIYRIPHQYSEVMELPVPEVSFSDYFVVGTI